MCTAWAGEPGSAWMAAGSAPRWPRCSLVSCSLSLWALSSGHAAPRLQEFSLWSAGHGCLESAGHSGEMWAGPVGLQVREGVGSGQPEHLRARVLSRGGSLELRATASVQLHALPALPCWVVKAQGLEEQHCARPSSRWVCDLTYFPSALLGLISSSGGPW